MIGRGVRPAPDDPAGVPCQAFAATGLAFDPTTGSMWLTNYWRQRLGELAPAS
jgi:hypothetical protein